MSWSVSTVALPKDVEDRVNALEVQSTEEFPARDDQLKAAKEAVLTLYKSGAVGTGEAFSISLYGHANEGHTPQQGYATDTVTVAITQTTADAVAQYDAAQEAYQKNLE